MFNNKTILVTGGSGSFGRQFIRTVLANYAPKKIIIYSRDEYKHYIMSQEFTHPCLRFFIGDVRDADRLRMAMESVDFVVHAAALKQVPAAEYNPMECIKTNINGAQNVIDAAIYCGVEKVVALSTDKAANPINLYGATKLCSDKLFTAANNLVGEKATRFSVVRYGNVVGSRGSVLPFFKKLIEQGENELPLTHRDMTRFWITLDQGVNFVLGIFKRMKGGGVFVPKIPSVRIVDLIRSMGPDIAIKDVGMRPGEKLHEIMCPADDSLRTFDYGGHYVIAPTVEFDNRRDFSEDALGHAGIMVPEGFEYHSGNNDRFLSVAELIELNNMVVV